jgi:hypothetical protein
MCESDIKAINKLINVEDTHISPFNTILAWCLKPRLGYLFCKYFDGCK